MSDVLMFEACIWYILCYCRCTCIAWHGMACICIEVVEPWLYEINERYARACECVYWMRACACALNTFEYAIWPWSRHTVCLCVFRCYECTNTQPCAHAYSRTAHWTTATITVIAATTNIITTTSAATTSSRSRAFVRIVIVIVWTIHCSTHQIAPKPMRIKLKSHSLCLSFHLCRRWRNYVYAAHTQVVHIVSQTFFDRTKWINDSFFANVIISFFKRMLLFRNCLRI